MSCPDCADDGYGRPVCVVTCGRADCHPCSYEQWRGRDPVGAAADDYWVALFVAQAADERGDDDAGQLLRQADVAWHRWHAFVEAEAGQGPEGGP